MVTVGRREEMILEKKQSLSKVKFYPSIILVLFAKIKIWRASLQKPGCFSHSNPHDRYIFADPHNTAMEYALSVFITDTWPWTQLQYIVNPVLSASLLKLSSYQTERGRQPFLTSQRAHFSGEKKTCGLTHYSDKVNQQHGRNTETVREHWEKWILPNKDRVCLETN